MNVTVVGSVISPRICPSAGSASFTVVEKTRNARFRLTAVMLAVVDALLEAIVAVPDCVACVGFVTPMTKVSTAVSPAPSSTVIVIVAVPVWLVAGVMVTVRLAPLPPNVMFPFGTSVVLLEVPLRVRLLAAVSASPIVKLIAGVAVFLSVDWLGMSLIVGAVCWRQA